MNQSADHRPSRSAYRLGGIAFGLIVAVLIIGLAENLAGNPVNGYIVKAVQLLLVVGGIVLLKLAESRKRREK